jgi:hypothetical protein
MKLIDKCKRRVYLFKRKLKYFFNPRLKHQLNRKAEKLFGCKLVETKDIFYGIRPEDCIPKDYIHKRD